VQAQSERHRPGAVLAVGDAGIDVACASGCLRITELQRAGSKRMRARDFLRGSPLPVGALFDQAPSP
jgi:methionyl-tRNA formyltransferase